MVRFTQQTSHDMFQFAGGINTTASRLSLQPGMMLNPCQNYTVQENGYQLCGHYERFDGQAKPSEALYTYIEFDTGLAEIADGDTVTGTVSGASGICIVTAVVESGSYAGSDAAGYVVLWVTSGTFVVTDELQVGAVTRATATVVEDPGVGSPDESTDKDWVSLAAAEARALIGAVPGSGRILGVWSYKGDVYAFRNNAGGTAAVMYKSTASGWSAVTLSKEITFDTGTAAFSVGETLSGSVSGDTATIESVYVTFGSFAGGNAAGVMTISNETGNFNAADVLTDTDGGSAQCSAIASTTALTASGYYEFENYNFSGASDDLKMYGCDGVNYGFSFDGTAFVRIRTGMATDTPKHISCHRNYLMFSFGASIQWSPLLDPYTTWTIVSGAGEVAIGDDCTGMESTVNGVLVITARNSIFVLYGEPGGADMELKQLSKNYGALEWTLQNTITPMYMSDSGLCVMPDTSDFGDFNGETISGAVQNIVNQYKDTITTSVAFRNKNEYRLFFSNGDALVAKFVNNQIAGYSMLSYPYPVQTCSASVRSDRFMASGTIETDHIFFGSDGTDGGYVYQMDVGTSQDGADITAFFRMPFHHGGTPRVRKQYRRAIIETETETGGSVTFYFQPDFGLFEPGMAEASTQTILTDIAEGNWNEVYWNQFFWSDAGSDEFYEARIEGVGCGIGGTIYYIGAKDPIHTLKSMIIHYDLRSMRR